MNVIEYIFIKLEELGIESIFSAHASYESNLYNLAENNTNQRLINCTNILNAAFAADGYARINGYGAVITENSDCLKVINPVASAFYENLPLIILNSTYDSINFTEQFNQITAASTVLSRDKAKTEIDRVLLTLVKEKKPVYIGIPQEIYNTDIQNQNTEYEWTSDKDNLKKAAQAVVEKIKSAKNPIIIGDALIKRFNAIVEYKELIDKSGIPTANFISGTNIINMSKPNYIGGCFGQFYNSDLKERIDKSDCIITVGRIDTFNNPYKFKLPDIKPAVIEISGTGVKIENKLYKNVKMSELLESVTELTEYKEYNYIKPIFEVQKVIPEQKALSAEFIYRRIQEFIKENDIILAETDTVVYSLSQVIFPDNTNLEFQSSITSYGWGTPALLGALAAKPNARIILITSDDAHAASALEIGTIIKYGYKPIVMILNNITSENKDYIENTKKSVSNYILRINYSKLSRVFDGDVWPTRARSEEDFDKALKVSHIMNKMCYIELDNNINTISDLTNIKLNNIKQNIITELQIVSESSTESQFVNNDVVLNRDIEYETTVHSNIIYDEIDEDTDNVAGENSNE